MFRIFFFYPVDFRKKEAFHLSVIFVTSAIFAFWRCEDDNMSLLYTWHYNEISFTLDQPKIANIILKKILNCGSRFKIFVNFFYLPKLLYESIRPEVFKPRKLLQKIFVMTYSLWKCTIFRILYYINIRKEGLQVR